MPVNVSVGANDADMLARISAVVHDAQVVDVGISVPERLTLRLERPGYEYEHLISNGVWGFGRRWMCPWVECQLAISPISSVNETVEVAGVRAFDGVMTLRLSGNELIIHREFSDITVGLLSESTLRLEDTGQAIDPRKGMVIVSRRRSDLSYIAGMIGVRPN